MHTNEYIKMLESLKEAIGTEFENVREYMYHKEAQMKRLVDILISTAEDKANEELKEIEAQSRKEGIFNAASGT